MILKFYLVDVFTNEKFCGNTAAVVILNENIDDEGMQKIANTLKQSETVFVKKIDNYSYENRFFTPTEEVDLCGHATIAAFHIISSEAAAKHMDNYKQKTKAGNLGIFIKKSYNNQRIIMMENAKPILFDEAVDIEDVIDIFNINKSDVGLVGNNVLPMIISTGLKDIILPIKSLRVLNRLEPNYLKLKEFSRKKGVIGVHAFTLDTINSNNSAHCRNFAPLVGINEEAATGSSSGSLAYYLFVNNIIDLFNNEEIDLCFEQGYKMGRPSLIRVDIQKINEEIRIFVGGEAVLVGRGELIL